MSLRHRAPRNRHCAPPKAQLAGVVVTLVCLASPSLSARPNGYAVPCGGCHYGELGGGAKTPKPNVTALPSAVRVGPGEQVNIAVSVESTWPDARVAGFLVLAKSEAGVFSTSEDGVGNVGEEEGAPWDYAMGHVAARELQQGGATFNVSWAAPSDIGAYTFEVYAVTSDDGDGMDDPDVNQESNDSFGQAEFTLGVGCDVVSYYLDGDSDGFGGTEVLACEQPPGSVLQGGDCNDADPLIHPGATELCSFVDEDCDGDRMAPAIFYADIDGDGFGDASDILVDNCVLPPGYAVESGDCAPTDPTIHPGALEVVGNDVDENCDGSTDSVEAPGSNAPVGSAPSAPAMPSATGPSATGTPGTPMGENEASCSMAPSPRGQPGFLLGLGLAWAALQRRRRSGSNR